MDKQSSKKPFFIMPEWAWAIVVGMFMLLLFLNHVIPGHAANLYPQTPDQLGYGANYVSHITVKGGELYVGGTYISNVGLILQESEDRIAQFEADADAALNSLFSQIPKDQTYFALADDSAYGSVLVWLRSFLDERDIQYSEIIIDYEDPFWYPQQWPDNWRDAYSESIYSLGPYSVYVYVRKSLLAPSPTPLPPQTYYFKFSAKDYYGYHYYMVSFEATSLGRQISFPANDSFIGYIAEQNNFNPSAFSGTAFVYRSGRTSDWNQAAFGKPALAFYFTSEFFQNFKLYEIPNATAYELEPASIVSTYSGSFVSDTGYVKTYRYSNIGVSCFLFSQALQVNNNYRFDSFSLGSCYGFDYTYQDVYSTVDWARTYGDYPTYELAPGWTTTPSFAYYGYLGLLGKFDEVENPNGPQPSVTPSPSPSPVPLPTSGESVHVILPTGTPSPTPPFSVPGGSNGDPGSGSPGSVGSGISASQSSGILSYFSSFLSNNPALAFIAACFPVIPSEILYPLFILLFILMILAAIRLFVHFAGG